MQLDKETPPILTIRARCHRSTRLTMRMTSMRWAASTLTNNQMSHSQVLMDQMLRIHSTKFATDLRLMKTTIGKEIVTITITQVEISRTPIQITTCSFQSRARGTQDQVTSKVMEQLLRRASSNFSLRSTETERE